jgi:hypothetical protein
MGRSPTREVIRSSARRRLAKRDHHYCPGATGLATDCPYDLYGRSCRQQTIEFGRRIGFAFWIGDDDLPAFTRPNPRLGYDQQRTLSFDLHRLVLAFCDHLVDQLRSSARLSLLPPVDSRLWPQFAESVTIWCRSPKARSRSRSGFDRIALCGDGRQKAAIWSLRGL